jgi:hypothetical protein
MHMHTPATLRRNPGPPAHPGALRVSGQLEDDARLTFSTGRQPHMHLHLRMRPAVGLHYVATLDLGDDAADHMAAEALLPHMRSGAMVSVAAAALQLRMDHGHAVLVLQQPHSVVLFDQPTEHPHTPPAPQAGATTTPPQESAHAPA